MLLRFIAVTLLAFASSCAGCGAPKPEGDVGRFGACEKNADCKHGLECLVFDKSGKPADCTKKCVDPNDLDGDGIPNAQDPDIDGDGIPNQFDNDVDGDCIPNGQDPDPYGPNNDGVSEKPPHECSETSGLPNSCNPNCIGPWGDCDNDGVPNSIDNDDNGDGIPDGVIGCGSCDGGKTTTCDENADCDGYCLTAEGGYIPCNDCPAGTNPADCAAPGAGVPDTDGDGIPDPQDPDPLGTGQQPPLVTGEGEGEGEGTAGEGEGEGAPCNTINFSPGQSNLEPRILFVVDKSGSMGDPDNSGTQKYQACKSAIETVSNNLNGTIDMGLMHFPGDSNADACSQGVLDVAVAAGTAGQIANVLESTSPGGGTPTAVTLLQAKAALDALPSAGGPRAIVLATDGGPNCNGSLDGSSCVCVSGNPADCQQSGGQFNCLDDSNTINAASQVNGAGYSVFVIGEVGSENFTSVLNSIAVAGGTAQAGSVKFYAAGDETDLVNALDQIAVRVGACRIDLGQNVTSPQVTVTVNGQPVSQDTSRQDGWDLVDPHTVELFGQPCTDTVNGGANASVAVNVCGG
jgi:hypothetical protein